MGHQNVCGGGGTIYILSPTLKSGWGTCPPVPHRSTPMNTLVLAPFFATLDLPLSFHDILF